MMGRYSIVLMFVGLLGISSTNCLSLVFGLADEAVGLAGDIFGPQTAQAADQITTDVVEGGGDIAAQFPGPGETIGDTLQEWKGPLGDGVGTTVTFLETTVDGAGDVLEILANGESDDEWSFRLYSIRIMLYDKNYVTLNSR